MPFKTVFKINSREGKFGCESYDNNICQSILLSITSGIKLYFPDDTQKHNINNNNNNIIIIIIIIIIIKLNQSHYRPEVPRGFQEVNVPRLRDNGPGWWQVVSQTHRPLFTPKKYSWYSFLLEAESTPGPQCDRKDYVNEKFQ